jgi:UDPglucose 6-dehydrogenase
VNPVTERICIIGCGYVGLTTGLHLSDSEGTEVSFIEKNAERLTSLAEGKLPITEPGLEELFVEGTGRLKFYESLSNAPEIFDQIYVCVGTPSTEDGISLAQITEACRDIDAWIYAKNIKDLLIIVRSTIIPGSTRSLFSDVACKHAEDRNIEIVYNPEFLREGAALSDIRNAGRNLYGTHDGHRCRRFEEKVREPMVTTWETAEFSKYYSNIFYVSLMSYSNEMARIAERLPFHVDMTAVVEQHLLDKRFSKAPASDLRNDTTSSVASYLVPSFGYGGSCFPKDSYAFFKGMSNFLSEESALLSAFIKGNSTDAAARVSAVLKSARKLGACRPAMLGLTFKPGTTDLRNSPAMTYLEHLLTMFKGNKILLHDPMDRYIDKGFIDKFDDSAVEFAPLEKILEWADFVSITTAWEDYKDIDIADYENIRVVVDAKSLLGKTQIIKLEKAGVCYFAPGRVTEPCRDV